MKKVLDLNNPINLPVLNHHESNKKGNELLSSEEYLMNFLPLIGYSGTVPFERVPLTFTHNLYLKRIVDILFSIVIIVCLLSWLIPILAIIIKLDSRGPVFFLQKRNKRNGKVFICIKLRTMIVNKDADILQAEENDKRITRFGKYLRKNHFDELPQLFNVLWGDISVIGPRPHMISDNLRYAECVDFYALRLRVKPGITGLAQVMGYTGPVKKNDDMKNRIRMDNYYIRHWSLKLDTIIFFTTLIKFHH